MHEREVDDDPRHVESGVKYVAALVALLLLTVLTFGLHFAPLGIAEIPIALVIFGSFKTVPEFFTTP